MSSLGDRASSDVAPCLWNQLPVHIRSLETCDSIKSYLKTALFTKKYSIISFNKNRSCYQWKNEWTNQTINQPITTVLFAFRSGSRTDGPRKSGWRRTQTVSDGGTTSGISNGSTRRAVRPVVQNLLRHRSSWNPQTWTTLPSLTGRWLLMMVSEGEGLRL